MAEETVSTQKEWVERRNRKTESRGKELMTPKSKRLGPQIDSWPEVCLLAEWNPVLQKILVKNNIIISSFVK